MKNSNNTKWQAVDRNLGNPVTKEELIDAIKSITPDSRTGNHIMDHLKNSNAVGSKINFETLEELKKVIIEKIQQIPEKEFTKRGITIDFGKIIGETSVISKEEMKNLKQTNNDIIVGVLKDNTRAGTNGVYMQEGGIPTSKITIIIDKDEKTDNKTVVRTIFSGENAPPLPIETYTRNFLVEAQKLLSDIKNKEKLSNFLKFTNFFVNVINKKDQNLINLYENLNGKLQGNKKIEKKEIYELVSAVAKKYNISDPAVFKLEDIKNNNFWNSHYFVTNNKNLVVPEKELSNSLLTTKIMLDSLDKKLNFKTPGEIFKFISGKFQNLYKILKNIKESIKKEITSEIGM